jgi:hypothetical protein
MKKIKKEFRVKIQSASDIITNSSSEVYQIKTDIPWLTFREIWDSILRYWGESEEDIRGDETISGTIREEDGYLILAYDIVCNVDGDIFGKLKELFGEENVKDITWENW